MSKSTYIFGILIGLVLLGFVATVQFWFGRENQESSTISTQATQTRSSDIISICEQFKNVQGATTCDIAASLALQEAPGGKIKQVLRTSQNLNGSISGPVRVWRIYLELEDSHRVLIINVDTGEIMTTHDFPK